VKLLAVLFFFQSKLEIKDVVVEAIKGVTFGQIISYTIGGEEKVPKCK